MSQESDKLQEGNLLIFDISTIPMQHGMDSEMWFKLMKEHNVAFYDSHLGEAPKVVEVGDAEHFKVEIVDVSTEEGKTKLEEYGKDI